LLQENKDLVWRYFDERWNKRNYDIVDELDGRGDPEGHKAWLRSVHANFSAYEETIDDMIAEGDRVALHFTSSGVLTGPYEGVGSAGDRVSFAGLALLRIANGHVVEDVAYWDGPNLVT